MSTRKPPEAQRRPVSSGEHIVTKSFRAAAITTVLVLALTAIGAAPASAAAPDTGRVKVTITALGGIRIPSVKVKITAKDVSNPGGAAQSHSGGTNLNGWLMTPELAPGTYTLTAQIEKPASTKTTTMTVKANVDGELTVAMPGVQYITGTVKAFGEAVSYARVNATDGKASYGVNTSAGKYRLLVKQGPAYRVVVRPIYSNMAWLATYAGNTVRKPDAKIITPSKLSAAKVNIAAYDKTGQISGRVLTPSGKLAKNARVTACPNDRWGCVVTSSNSAGEFVARGIPASSDVRLTASTSTAFGEVRGLTVQVGKTTKKSVTIRKDPPRPTYTGKILLTLNVSSAVVKAYAACAALSSIEVGDYSSDCLNPGERKMVFSELPAGRYRIFLPGTSVSASVTVKDDAVTRITLTRPTGTTITGKVTTPGGAPVKDASVFVRDANGNSLRGTSTNGQGAYRVPFADSGTYTVSAYPASDSYVPTTKRASVSATNPTINITLTRSITLTGKVVDSAGRPVAGVDVTANSDLGYASARTNSKGVYTLRGLAPGTHRVTTLDWYPGGYLDATSRAVTVSAGKTATIPTVTLRD
jgi:hypothetical protein